MLDALLRRHLAGPLAPVAAWLHARKVRGLALTICAFLCAAVAMLDIGHGEYLLGLGLLAAAGLFDLLDGPVARAEGPAPFGAYLDTVLSLTAGAGVAFAFALAEPDRALAAMFLMFGLVARTASDTGAASPIVTGLIGKTEFFVAFAVACLFPQWFSIVAYLVGILCFVSAGSRLAIAAGRT